MYTRKIKFFNTLVRPDKVLEGPFPDSATDKKGFITMKERIESFMRSGENLKASRSAFYDETDPQKFYQVEPDLTRHPHFDRVDAFQLAEAVAEKMRKDYAKALKEKAENEKKEKEALMKKHEKAPQTSSEAPGELEKEKVDMKSKSTPKEA